MDPTPDMQESTPEPEPIMENTQPTSPMMQPVVESSPIVTPAPSTLSPSMTPNSASTMSSMDNPMVSSPTEPSITTPTQPINEMNQPVATPAPVQSMAQSPTFGAEPQPMQPQTTDKMPMNPKKSQKKLFMIITIAIIGLITVGIVLWLLFFN